MSSPPPPLLPPANDNSEDWPLRTTTSQDQKPFSRVPFYDPTGVPGNKCYSGQCERVQQKKRSAAQDAVFHNRRMTRSAIKRQKLDDFFSSRRMTRFAFKQIVAEEKVQKKKRSEDDYLTVRYLPVHQQQHGKGKGKGKGKNPMEFPAYDIGSFTKKEREMYNKVVLRTDGFGFLYVPPRVAIPGLLTSLQLRNVDGEVLKFYHDMANLAVRHHNEQYDTRYRFVKIIGVNYRWDGLSCYNITLQAKDDTAGSLPQNFQARIYKSFAGDPKVIFCRVEQEFKPIEDRLKLSVAGCAKGNPGRGGFGGLVLNQNGVLTCGFYGRLELCTIEQAKLWGLYRGLMIMLQKGCYKFEVETDSESVRDLILYGAPLEYPWRNLIEVARAILASCQASISSILRDWNGSADMLADTGAVEEDELKLITEMRHLPEPARRQVFSERVGAHYRKTKEKLI